MKNTIENKEKYFAIHWKQKVACFKIGKSNVGPYTIGYNNQFSALCRKVEYGFKNAYLLLTPLSMISEKDAIEVIKMALGVSKLPKNITLTNTTDRQFGISFWLNHEEEYSLNFQSFYSPTLYTLESNGNSNVYLHNAVKIADYLRSKGYALPFDGLTVEQLISYGWLKLNTQPLRKLDAKETGVTFTVYDEKGNYFHEAVDYESLCEWAVEKNIEINIKED